MLFSSSHVPLSCEIQGHSCGSSVTMRGAKTTVDQMAGSKVWPGQGGRVEGCVTRPRLAHNTKPSSVTRFYVISIDVACVFVLR